MRSVLATVAGLVATLLSASGLHAQERVVTGRVVDAATQQGVPGALVSVVNGTRTAQANEAGQFRIALPATEVTLQVRGLGYRQVQVRVSASQATVDVGLQREAIKLSEVVVTGAATTQERRNVGTAVSTVSADEVSRVPAASLDNALQGKVIGANINMNSGAPGGGGQIQIRGVTSILGNGEPLFVVDGVIISNQAFSTGVNSVTSASRSGGVALLTSAQDNPVNRLSDINPQDIESVQVLKSAAATAIYGSKATNGVVLITTKRGRSGAPAFTVRQRVGTNEPLKLLGSRRFTQQTLREAYNKPTNRGGLGDRYAAFEAKFCPTETCPYYDYQKDLYGQRTPSTETSISMSGGGADNRYFVAGNHAQDNGTMLGTWARKQSLRLNLDQTYGTRWTGNVSAAVSRNSANRGISNNDNSLTSPFYLFGYTPALQDLTARQGGNYVNNEVIVALKGKGSNPFQTMERLRNTEDVWRQIASGQVRFTAFSNAAHSVTLQANGGYDRYDNDAQVYSPNFLQFEPDDGFLGTAVQGGTINRQLNGTLSLVHTYTPSGGSVIPFLSSSTFSAGLQTEDRSLNRFVVRAQGLVPTIDLIDQGTPTLSHSKQLVRDQAFFINEEVLAFDERLSLSGRVRGERSSVNGDVQQFHYWPAATAAYRFVNVLPFTNELKLRASVGTSGNQPTYGMRHQVVQGLGLIEGRSALGVPGAIGNQRIKPERMTEREYGVDALFWDSRVGVEASYFDRTITDLLLTAPLPPSSGYSSQFVNGGEMKTDGLEAVLSLTPVRTQAFQWNTRAQYYTFRSRLMRLPAAIQDFIIPNSGFGPSYGRGRIACPRAPGSDVCGSRVITVNGQEVKTEPYSTTLVWGNRLRPDGTSADTVLGESRPDFTMQFSNDITWRRLSVSGLVDWRKGGLLSVLTKNLFDEGLNSWDYDKPSGFNYPANWSDSTKRGQPMPLGAYRYSQWNGGRNAAPYVEDGSFVKLREVTVSYLLPERVAALAQNRVRDLRLSFTGRNLWMSTDYWGVDPEVNNFGAQNVVRFVDLAPYPSNRSYFLALDFSF